MSSLGYSRPKLVCPCPGTAAPVQEGSKSAPTLFTPAPVSKLPAALQQKAGDEKSHSPAPTIPGRAQGTQGDQGTWLAAPHPTRSPEQGPETDTILHPHPCNSCLIWDPSRHSHGEITGTSAPWPKGWKGREAAHSCTQDRTWMSPKPGQKQQAGGLLIASRGALVCLSILQQTRFAALIPIWK